MREDATVQVAWDGPRQIVITAPAYAGNFVFSEDLRRFDLPMREGRRSVVQTGLGELRTDALDQGLRIVLTLEDASLAAGTRFFYFSDGRVQPLAPPPGSPGAP
jgi:hypothetical protein